MLCNCVFCDLHDFSVHTNIYIKNVWIEKIKRWIIAVFVRKCLCTKDTGNNNDNKKSNKESIIYFSPGKLFFSLKNALN